MEIPMSKIKTKQVNYWVKWIVNSQADAVKAIIDLIEEGNVISSFGKGDDQYEGFEANEGTFTIEPYKGKCMVTWVSVPEDFVKDYWMSPTCFENVQTFDKDFNDMGTEAFEWGITQC